MTNLRRLLSSRKRAGLVLLIQANILQNLRVSRTSKALLDTCRVQVSGLGRREIRIRAKAEGVGRGLRRTKRLGAGKPNC